MRHMRIQPTFSNISIHYLIKRLQKYIFGNPSTCSLVQPASDVSEQRGRLMGVQDSN